ncbi:MAG TPA: AsmA-like C-terminal region-containing protein [Acidobacteriaceae bacterium]|nr:AsmA-like C-terminal region-containing protein [Acidobacteriaceae bacterium]
MGIIALGTVVVIAAIFEILLHRAEPILRARLVQSLSARFHSRVDLGELDVSLLRGFEVSGKDLAIYPYNIDSGTPTFSVRHFAFRTGYSSLIHSPLHIGHVEVEGLRINLPPKSQRKQGSQAQSHSPEKVTVFVDQMDCTDTILTLGTDKPGRLPTRFVIQKLNLRSIGPGKPLDFTAMLTNPKPVGQIETRGNFGPWNADRPGDTALGGTYSFHDADLGTIKGIGGILSSQGAYQGELDKIVVDGETDTPDFQVKISGHKVPLHTEFHAIVDGTDGNTWLQPVKAQFLHSFLVARGYVVRVRGEPGRRVYLDVDMDQARIEDLLRLAVRTDPPVMSGQVKLHTRLDLPPGPQDVAHRLRLQGNFAVINGRFTSEKIQNRIDELSLRSQGEVELATQQARDGKRDLVRSQLSGDFTLADAALNLPDLHYDIPGARIRLAGTYTLDGAKFNFAGTADMQATVSRMVGGWKGVLLMPFDHVFQKNGVGTEIPFKIDGTKSNPQFGLDFDRLKKK